MKLPYVDKAIIAKEKITEYLLSETHPDGKSKAAFFMRVGFSADAWEALADALRLHAAEHEVSEIKASPHGVKYVIDGPLAAPDGRSPEVRGVWLVDEGEEIPRLITAHPLERKERS